MTSGILSKNWRIGVFFPFLSMFLFSILAFPFFLFPWFSFLVIMGSTGYTKSTCYTVREILLWLRKYRFHRMRIDQLAAGEDWDSLLIVYFERRMFAFAGRCHTFLTLLPLFLSFLCFFRQVCVYNCELFGMHVLVMQNLKLVLVVNQTVSDVPPSISVPVCSMESLCLQQEECHVSSMINKEKTECYVRTTAMHALHATTVIDRKNSLFFFV